jgi:flavodoxin
LYVSKIISKFLDLDIIFVEDNLKLENYEEFFIVISNRGDEELPLAFELFLKDMTLENKKYHACELGNYFGFEYDFFGSKKILDFILQKLKWQKISCVSIDTFPIIDQEKLERWINGIL